MKDRRDRILDVAIELAEQGGYNNVRQRDVAARAGVALGTLYKRFRSKEDILCAALDRETAALERHMEAHPAAGDDPIDRVSRFFNIATRGMCRKPNYARAVIRAMASGEPEVATNVAAYHGRMNGLIINALRGPDADSTVGTNLPSDAEDTLALLLQQTWFAGLVGWSAGIRSPNEVVSQMRDAARLLFRGLHAREEARLEQALPSE